MVQKVIAWFDAEVANVQNEEPGAGKPHAWICALSITHKSHN